ncbi:zinc transport system substrate-binding protein [Dysgonomonadaceae bacterium PH5-43]|nr:zinc transport system substrate-binding protein [Dysgonomonadaceae bacterium PH5-43]
MRQLLILALLLSLTSFTYCVKNSVEKENIITVTIEPQRYFAEQIADSLYSIQTMVPPSVSPEDYDPSPKQMIGLAKSVAYFQIGYIGFENAWLDKLKKNNKDVLFFNNGEGISYIHSEHDHSHTGHHHKCSEMGIDPHSWSSPKQAAIIAENMYKAFCDLDSLNAEFYRRNYEQLIQEINELDSLVDGYLTNSSQKNFIIYHPALTYFARDYNLTQYSIEIDGKEPSPEQLKKLIDTAKEKQIKTIFIQEEFDKKNAETIAKETGCTLISINPLSYNWKEEIIKISKALSDE